MSIPPFEEIVSLENLLKAWKEFLRGKKSRKDVQEFEQHLMSNMITLHHDLVSKRYVHSAYEAFTIADPKPRNIHKAKVRDRLIHHALYRALYPAFDKMFIADSYSCRYGRGTHKAISRFETFSRKISKNYTRQAYVLKCDIRKFFASIDQKVLLEILQMYITDKDTLWLLSQIIRSFHSTQKGIGLPLGNLTSQLLVNIYMNEFDQFVKHRIHAEYYIRYADDFVVFSDNRAWLDAVLSRMDEFLSERLHLTLHPDKIFVRTVGSGVDFLGWVHFPYHRVLRTVTQRRMFRNSREKQKEETIQSYLGLLQHGNTYKLRQKLRDIL